MPQDFLLHETILQPALGIMLRKSRGQQDVERRLGAFVQDIKGVIEPAHQPALIKDGAAMIRPPAYPGSGAASLGYDGRRWEYVKGRRT